MDKKFEKSEKSEKNVGFIFIFFFVLSLIVGLLLFSKEVINNTIETIITSNLIKMTDDNIKENEIKIDFITKSNVLIIKKEKVTISGDIIKEKSCVNLLYKQQKLNDSSTQFSSEFKRYLNKCIEYRKNYIYNIPEKNTLILYSKK